jgi:hypothetical protein
MAWRSLLVFLIACGGSSNNDGGGGGDVMQFVGVYTMTSHTSREMFGSNISCTDPGTPLSGAKPYFELAPDEFFMDPDLLRVSECTDAAATSCTESLVSMRAGGPGLVDENASSQIGGGAPCQLHFTRSDASLSGTTMSIEVLEKYDAPNISASDCTVERAQTLSSSPDCRRVERWTGTKR